MSGRWEEHVENMEEGWGDDVGKIGGGGGIGDDWGGGAVLGRWEEDVGNMEEGWGEDVGKMGLDRGKI